MSINEELNALRVDAALAGDESQVRAEDKPYLRMAQALKTHAAWEEEVPDPTVMETQKNRLLQTADDMTTDAQRVTHSAKLLDVSRVTRHASRPWWFWTGATAVVATAVVVFFVTQTGTNPLKKFNQATKMASLVKLSLIIPQANAADAFSMQVAHQGAGGAEIDTTFQINSKVPIEQSALNQNLKLIKISDQGESDVAYDLQASSGSGYDVKPQQLLDPGSVYRVVIATAVKDEKGDLRQRDFSWAVQTKNTFKIIRSVPGNTATGVPLDTAIEVMLSQTDWSDPVTHFAIQPSTPGRFETHGRTLVFLPDKPLVTSTLYTVTFKQGWGVAGGGPALEQDYVMRFQTANSQADQAGNQILYLGTYLAEAAPGNEPIITLGSDQNTPVEVTGYNISFEQAKSIIQEVEKQPFWADCKNERDKAIAGLAKNQAFTASLQLEGALYGNKTIRLPGNLVPGVYAVQLKQGSLQPAWLILQITKLSAFMMADRDRILVWTVNTETGKPLAQIPVVYENQTAKTDSQGLTRLNAPENWRNASNDQDRDESSAVLTFGEGDMKLLAVLRNQHNLMYFGAGSTVAPMAYNTWSYLFSDRPLYRSQDKVNVFGLAQDRATGRGLGKAVVQIQNYGLVDFGTYENKVFAQGEFVTDESGFFSGQLVWKGSLSPGYYSLVLLRDGQSIATRTIEIRDVIKPAYYLQIIPDKTSIFAGEEAGGQVMAKFYDGTPVVKARISLNASGGFLGNQPQEVTTDDMGYARYSFKTAQAPCNLTEQYVSCAARDTLSIEARPALGEEGEIYVYASHKIWRGHLFLGSESEKEDQGQAVMRYRVRQVDLTRENGREEDSVLTDGAPNVTVKAKAIEQHWEKIQTGTYYDPMEKKVVPQYNFEMRDVETGGYESKTDSGGYVTFTFPMRDDFSYRLLVWLEDNGSQQAYTSYISKGWYNRFGDDTPVLVPTAEHDQKNSYRLGEKVSVSFMRSGQKLSSDKASFLFVHAARGLREAQFSSDPTHEFEFTDQDIPNLTVYGIAFLKNGFVTSPYSAGFDTEEKNLKVVLQPDKAGYAPGEQVTFQTRVTTKDGNPISDARLAVTVADEALLAISQLDSSERPLDNLYGWQPDGIIATNLTHNTDMNIFAGSGGAERGGGGRSGQVRRNFKDQAVFLTLRTAADGTATGSFTLPDNITSWRFTAVAVTPDLRAGTARLNVSATKALFVDAVVPQNILISDKAVLKLRVFGTALPKTGDVAYTVDASTLGINHQQVKGPVGKAVYLSLEHSVMGEHKALISITLDGTVQDTIERTIKILTSRATHDERVTVELAPGIALPDVGQMPEVQVTFESKTRGALRAEVEALAHPWSARLESAVAGRAARILLRDDYQVTSTNPNEIQVSKYQRSSGGLGVLPYSSEDVALSSKVAAADPDGVDRSLLANYFWTVTDDPKASREQSIQALAGLAALGQPVIERLHAVAEIKDLSWRETLAVIRGLDAIGERETARGLLDNLLSKAQEHDGVMTVNISQSQAENIEATAEAAAIAAVMAHPAAGKLAAFVATNWNLETLTDLDRIMYLQKIVPLLLPVDVSLTYTLGQDTKTINFKEQPVFDLRLTAEEVKAFRVVSINGPAVASFVKRAVGDTLKTSALLSINRDYTQEGKPIKELHEGDLVKVSLTSTWDPKAQDGCYMLRDRLPAAMMPVVNISFDRYQQELLYYPYDTTENEVSFVVCKQDKPLTLNYLARVTSIGSYTAGGALLQSMETPSLASVSAPRTLEIK